MCRIFEISKPDMAMFDGFSDYLKKIIQDSPEWRAQAAVPTPQAKSGFEDMDDDMPF
jgi:hypothetical protein